MTYANLKSHYLDGRYIICHLNDKANILDVKTLKVEQLKASKLYTYIQINVSK